MKKYTALPKGTKLSDVSIDKIKKFRNEKEALEYAHNINQFINWNIVPIYVGGSTQNIQ